MSVHFMESNLERIAKTLEHFREGTMGEDAGTPPHQIPNSTYTKEAIKWLSPVYRLESTEGRVGLNNSLPEGPLMSCLCHTATVSNS